VQARDTVACVNQLAAKGRQGKVCGLAANLWSKTLCRIGNAEISVGKSYHKKRRAVNW
jgi:hypothetical protein